MVQAEDMGNYYRIPPDLRDLNYSKFVEQGDKKLSKGTEYNSHNTERLSVKDMQNLLIKLPFIISACHGEFSDPEN